MGVQLQSGWNTVAYQGPCVPGTYQQPVESAIASIKDQLIIMWTVGGEAFYDPNDPGSNLAWLHFGHVYQLNVSQAVYWDWDQTQPPPPPEEAFAQIFDTGYIPTTPQQPASFVNFTVAVKNTGQGAGLCYIQPYNETGAIIHVSGSQNLQPGQTGYFVLSFTMGEMNVSFSLQTWHDAAPGYDDSAGPFTIPVSAPQPKVTHLEVGYAIA